MTNTQTEARAIARRLWKEHGGAQFGPHTETLSMPLDRFGGFVDALIATALAAKDAELAKFDFEKHSLKVSLARAEAQLAEARKALEQRDTDITEFMGRLGSRWFLEQGWFPASVGAREDDARRARTGGKNG